MLKKEAGVMPNRLATRREMGQSEKTPDPFSGFRDLFKLTIWA
jgi:hypothetical protein